MKRTRSTAAPAAPTSAPAAETAPAGDTGSPAEGEQASNNEPPASPSGEVYTSFVAVRILRDHGDWSVNGLAELPANEVEDAETDGWACSHPDSVAAAG